MIIENLPSGLIHAHEQTGNQRGFLILGPEGSGTYMLSDAIDESCKNLKHRIVRRSFPHAGEWPDVHNLIEEFRFFNCLDINCIFIIRDFYATARSVKRRDNDREYGHLYHNQIGAVAQIAKIIEPFYGISRDFFTYITYEAFVGSEGFRRWLFEERLGLPYPEDFEVYDGNAKYYE